MGWNAQAQQARREQLAEAELARQRLTTRCLYCKRFRYTGTLRKGQAKLQAHRDLAHPDLLPLERARTLAKRKVRAESRGIAAISTQRARLTPAELHEREVLRRMVRSDLPALEKPEAA